MGSPDEEYTTECAKIRKRTLIQIVVIVVALLVLLLLKKLGIIVISM